MLQVGDVVKVIDETNGSDTAKQRPTMRGQVGTIVRAKTLQDGTELFLADMGKEVEDEDGLTITHIGADNMFEALFSDKPSHFWWVVEKAIEVQGA